MADGKELLWDRHFDNGRGKIDIEIDVDYRVEVTMQGKGSMEGVHFFVEAFDAAIEDLGRDNTVTAVVDMTELDGAPIRAQLILGKWLFKNKNLAESIAIYGGKPWEVKVAKAVFKIARMKRVGFFNSRPEAERFTGWAA